MATQLNASILDSFAIVQETMGSKTPLGSRELSRRLNMEHTHANRFLKTLTLTGMVCQTADRKYAPGASVKVLAAQSLHASGLLRNSLPFIRASRLPEVIPHYRLLPNGACSGLDNGNF